MTHGSTPGLPLFDAPTDAPSTSFLDRIKSLFTPDPDAIDAYEDGTDPEGVYEDHSAAGNGWEPPEEYESDGIVEDLAILAIMAGVFGLVYLRARWAGAAGVGAGPDDAGRREEARRMFAARDEGVAQENAGMAVLDEPLREGDRDVDDPVLLAPLL